MHPWHWASFQNGRIIVHVGLQQANCRLLPGKWRPLANDIDCPFEGSGWGLRSTLPMPPPTHCLPLPYFVGGALPHSFGWPLLRATHCCICDGVARCVLAVDPQRRGAVATPFPHCWGGLAEVLPCSMQGGLPKGTPGNSRRTQGGALAVACRTQGREVAISNPSEGFYVCQRVAAGNGWCLCVALLCLRQELREVAVTQCLSASLCSDCTIALSRRSVPSAFAITLSLRTTTLSVTLYHHSVLPLHSVTLHHHSCTEEGKTASGVRFAAKSPP